MASKPGASSLQKEHYESIHDDYVRHYFDMTSKLYRRFFIYNYLFRGLDLNGKKVADMCSSSGYNSRAVKKYFPTAETVGFDISGSAVMEYQKNGLGQAFQLDATKPKDAKKIIQHTGPFDCVMVIGGVHHCVADLKGFFEVINIMLKPGGTLIVYEPNADFMLESVRRVWYRMDKYFEHTTERALTVQELTDLGGEHFTLDYKRYMGGPAFYLILNSMIFRLPLFVKKILFIPLFAGEWVYNLFRAKFLYPSFVARWKKN